MKQYPHPASAISLSRELIVTGSEVVFVVSVLRVPT